MRKFNEEDITLFESLINQGEKILARYKSEQEDTLVSSEVFNSEYDQWRTDVFRLFETHFDLKNDIVFSEIGQNSIFIFKKRGAHYVEIILRAMKACYRIPYNKKQAKVQTQCPKEQTQAPVSVNIHNTNNQSQNQTQSLDVFVNLLKESIAPYQLAELKQIASSEAPVEEKRKSLIEKIMGFGSNVAASVLANILTHPEVVGSF